VYIIKQIGDLCAIQGKMYDVLQTPIIRGKIHYSSFETNRVAA
jgi:hypothetical protein